MDAMDSFNDQDLVLTLLNRSKTVQSQKFAIDVQSHILYQVRKRYGKEMIDNGVREAPFWVLVGAQMPAVLVEVGYISHPEECKILMSDTYQQDMANGIAEGITAYFIHNR
jgi:N-acetylmuramoyl-L-alanine amidase